MNYWWMNTDPERWNIFENLSPGETERWEARTDAAHITPKRHKGAELPSNILILCPNHHKEFDLGRNEIVERNGRLLRMKLNEREYSNDLSV